MPKRMLDDSFLTSTSVARCSPRAQDAFPRFILLADDFGCFEVIPRALAARGWVYRQDVTEADMVAWLEEYVAAGMACLWTVNERRYCYLTGWHGEHGQKHRAEYDREHNPKGSKRRTPVPPADLVEAIRSGARRDHDGLPPGIDRALGGNEPGNSREADSRKVEQIHARAGNGREAAGKPDSPGRFPGSAVPDAVPVPAAAGKETPPPAIPTKASHLATQAPNGQALLDALAADGWALTHASAERRARLEEALAVDGVQAALLAHIAADLRDRAGRGAETVTSIGFYLGEASALAKRKAIALAPPEEARRPLPVVDLGWFGELSAELRAAAEAAWQAKQAEVEATFHPSRAPAALASAAQALRAEYLP